MRPPVALTIAGSDSGGCAGIQADLRTFAAHRVHGTSVITALTAQNTLGVAAAEPAGLDMLEAQLESVLSDFDVAAVKTGMLADLHTLVVVGGAARAGRLPNLVIDPVLVTTTGDSLFTGDPGAYLDAFGDAPALLTPNIPEAEVLTGGRIGDLDGMREAARSLASIGPCPVLVTGGHLDGDTAVDVLYDGSDFTEYEAPRVDTNNTHGTGCTFSAAIAAGLARGVGLLDAIGEAKEYLTGALAASADWRLGKGPGPADHLWWLDRKDRRERSTITE
ncbi:bifunctional hydroxymethylpyrimidine kinase/phosphomethylpyrimidine kinase [Glycomyces salinus]|uniref:bifunctional hydroxymethylpyrimidine kinase/phosphomethylpyrimidine kinase n=1 Tax=Glycomyces salinus TaxID=980294 RepID=UPI0018EAC72F|nr:bifunctional hydroxymethylpyrimidine kinase/phosphomethylpyrimidine kinase [Glycomyces salinus]